MINIINIDPSTLTLQNISLEDTSIIPNVIITSSFSPVNSKIEYFIYDSNNSLLASNEDLRSYKPALTTPEGNIVDIILTPEEDAINAGYDTGIIKTIYNFITSELGSGLESEGSNFFISEISSTRTEIRLSSNRNPLFDVTGIDSENFLNSSNYEIYNTFRQNVESNNYFDEFYLNFGNNICVVGVNSLLEFDSENNTISLLIKLYEPLPIGIPLKTELSIFTKNAESVAYQIEFQQENRFQDTTIQLKGPNYNISLKDKTGPLTQYKNYDEILSTTLSGSLFQLINNISSSSPQLSTDYTDYEDFIFFSSAYQRLYNFKEKVINISSSQAQLDLIYSSISGPTTNTSPVSSSKLLIEKEIETIISSFDGYENFLYYTSGAYAWPKSNVQAPYVLYPPTSSQSITWYDNQLNTASEYDSTNQNNLNEIIPLYLRENLSNTNYFIFINLIGQFFDEIWLYTKDITEKLNASSNLYEGVSKDLVSTVLESLGTKIYDSTYTLENIYSSLIGLSSDGSLYPTTGSELITDYVTASISNPEVLPTIDDFVKLSYKKIYHNLPYLLKKKGTNAGLRSLINIFGIPDTILQINEFGGKNKTENNDWDYWQNKFNYKLDINGSNTSYIDIPWSVNTLWNAEDNVPNTLQFRFKTLGLDSAIARPSQSLWNLDNTGNTAIVLEYTGSGYSSGSYSGSIPSGSNEYATLKFIPNYTAAPTVSASIYLPFYNGGWWSVMVTRDDEDFILYAANKIYNGDDGFIIGYTGSSTANAAGTAWENGTNAYFGANGTLTIGPKTYTPFSGSYQEVRYYNTVLPSGTFYDYTMNPYSIEGVGINGAYDQLIFRGTLGNDLYTSSVSIHPKITGSYITQSFASDSDFTVNNGTFSVNKEFVFQDQIPSGIKNIVSKKIKNVSTVLPYSGSNEVNLPENLTLSPFININQNSYNSSSYSENINYVEVALSPQNEINDDINAQIGYFNIGDYIGDPRLISSSEESYPDLDVIRNDYFKKYSQNYNLWDYIRIIKYYDNALFKMIKDYVPVRSSLSTGIVIKQHILERNKYPVPQFNTHTTTSFYGSGSTPNIVWDTPFVFQNLEITGSPIQMYEFTGSTGGTMPDLFGLTSSQYTGNGIVNITQSWTGSTPSNLGPVTFTDSTQTEFYNGELSGSILQVTEGVLSNSTLDLIQIYATSSINNGILFTDQPPIPYTIPPPNAPFALAYGFNIAKSYYITFTVNNVAGFSTGPGGAFIYDNSGRIFRDSLTPPFPGQGQSLTQTVYIPNPVAPLYFGENAPTTVNNITITNIIIEEFNEEFNTNPISNNAVLGRPNSEFFDVDFSSNAIVAVNTSVIVSASRGSGSATPSTVPASNYSTLRITNPRYNGSKNSSPNFNIGEQNTIPVIESETTFFAYFTGYQTTNSELLSKTSFNIKFIVDDLGNVYNPNLTSSYYYNLTRTFNENSKAKVIFYSQTSSLETKFAGLQSVIKSAAIPQAIIFSQTGSDSTQSLNTIFFNNLTAPLNYSLNTEATYSYDGTPIWAYEQNQFITFVAPTISASSALVSVPNPSSSVIVSSNPSIQLIPKLNLNVQLFDPLNGSPNGLLDVEFVKTDPNIQLGNEQIIYNETISIPADNTLTPLQFTAPPQSIISESRYFVRARLRPVYNPTYFPSSVVGANNIINFTASGKFYFTQDPPFNSATSSFFTTGSPTSSVLTSSVFNSDFYGLSQIETTGSLYDFPYQPFIINRGDQIRFSADENQSYMITEVNSPVQNPSNTLFLSLDRNLISGSAINSFLIKTFTPNPNVVVLNIDNPNGISKEISGFLIPEFPSQTLIDKFDIIISNLSDKGLL
jgi:hypothetical protein